MYPPINKSTSLSENEVITWFYGKVAIDGCGTVEVCYPYSEVHNESFSLKNVELSTYPMIHIVAVPAEGWEFKHWEDSVTREIIEEDPNLLLNEYKNVNSTGFRAVFYASNLGI